MRNRISSAPFRFYKFWISPLLGNNCRFHPSCSAYTHESMQRHGVLKGLYLGFRRILRCNPWNNRPMTDPIPERFDWRGLFRYKRP